MKAKIIAIVLTALIFVGLLYFSHKSKQNDNYFQKNKLIIKNEIMPFLNNFQMKEHDSYRKQIMNNVSSSYHQGYHSNIKLKEKSLKLYKISFFDKKTALTFIEGIIDTATCSIAVSYPENNHSVSFNDKNNLVSTDTTRIFSPKTELPTKNIITETSAVLVKNLSGRKSFICLKWSLKNNEWRYVENLGTFGDIDLLIKTAFKQLNRLN